MRSIDTVSGGRKTYDQVQGFTRGRATADFGEKVRHYVFSRRGPVDGSNGVERVATPVEEFARRLRQEKGKDIWMMGGGGVIASFLDAGEIDEFMVHVIPTLIGEGIPLVAPRHRHIPSDLKPQRSSRTALCGYITK
jgi:dihydrofolate reductase